MANKPVKFYWLRKHYPDNRLGLDFSEENNVLFLY